MEKDEYWLINTVIRKIYLPYREMCCLVDRDWKKIRYDVEYKNCEELNNLVDKMLGGENKTYVIVKVKDDNIVSWREINCENL